MSIKVSVITVCCNSEKFLADAIGSVAAQTYGNIEYIVIDGQSADNTPGIIKRNENHISKWISEPDHGLYDAMNKGIVLATGDVVGFLHSDDFFSNEGVIGKIAAVFENTGTDAVFGDIRYVDQSDTSKVLTSRKYGKYSRWKMQLGWHPPHPSFYVKREFLVNGGMFDTSFDISADYDHMLWLLIGKGIRTEYIPEVLVKMRVGGLSNRTMINVRKKWHEDYRALRKNHFGTLLTICLKSLRPVSHFIHSPRYLFE
jgi:glycosyltransferase